MAALKAWIEKIILSLSGLERTLYTMKRYDWILDDLICFPAPVWKGP
jgi:hypothetical protein